MVPYSSPSPFSFVMVVREAGAVSPANRTQSHCAPAEALNKPCATSLSHTHTYEANHSLLPPGS